jgi:hypothetical protein
MRAFIRIRKHITINTGIQNELAVIKKKLNKHGMGSQAIIAIIDRMMKEKKQGKEKIGF